jgi:hypothetical protein
MGRSSQAQELNQERGTTLDGRQRRPGPAGDLVLGRGLRPIVFGGTATAPSLFAPGLLERGPELVLSVHSTAGELLGYSVIDRSLPRPPLGGLTIGESETLETAVRVARLTTHQLRLFGIGRGSHHNLLLVPAGADATELARLRQEYITAVQPIVQARLCQTLFTLCGDAIEPELARRGAALSAAAAGLTALEYLGLEPTRATVAADASTAALDAARELVRRGVRPAMREAPDLVVLGSPPTGEETEASVVLDVSGPASSGRSEDQLHEAGVVLVPTALAGAGLPIAVDLRSRGLGERAVLAETFKRVRVRTRELLEETDATGDSLAAVTRVRALPPAPQAPFTESEPEPDRRAPRIA